MSLALIEESAKEVRRLAIAGSPLAVGDFRLKKLIPPLEQAGAKIPVFAQVAKAVSDLVSGTEAESASRLLNLSTLLNAILYTQGQTGVTGEIQKLETFPAISARTRTTARVLKPLVQALTSAGAGRFEMIRSAVERGAFDDLRLIDPAIQGLGDSFAELADLVAEKIVPAYGPGIVPRLKATFDPKGKKHDARKLTVMHRLDPAGTIELCKAALEAGSPEVKAAAVTCLGQHEGCLPIVLEQAKAKNKEVRAAALEALATHDRPEVTTLFRELLKGKALDILARPFRVLRNQDVMKTLLVEAKQAFEGLLKGEEEMFARYWEILTCFGCRNDAEIEDFVLTCFSASAQIAKLKFKKSIVAAGDLNVRLAEMLYQIGSQRALEAVVAKRDSLPAAAFPQVLHAALRSWPPEKVFTEFSPFLGQKKGSGKERRETLEQTIYATHYQSGVPVFGQYVPESSLEPMKDLKWDDRWLDAAIKEDHADIVCCLARPGHKATVTYLLKQIGSRNPSRSGLIIQALAKCKYARLTDTFLELVAKRTKGSKHWDYDLQQLIESARFLPAADLPRLEEFAANLDQNYQDHFLESIAPLRSTPQSN